MLCMLGASRFCSGPIKLPGSWRTHGAPSAVLAVEYVVAALRVIFGNAALNCSVMTLAEVCWKSFLEPGSEQPPDVFFKIIEHRLPEEMSELAGAMGVFTFVAKEVSEDAAKDTSSSTAATSSNPATVSAHKFLLAGASPVFRRQFMGPMKENSDEIEIKDTTSEAFKTMIDYLYTPPGRKFAFSPQFQDEDDCELYNCPQRLCELYNLAERYQLDKLKPIVVQAMSAEVNISSYPARILAGLFFFCRAEILNSGGFVQKYSDQGVSCKNIGQ